MIIGSLVLRVLVLASVLLAGPALATSTGPPVPPPETLDCSKDNNSTLCIECGGDEHLACCWDDDCKVINKPKKTLGPLRRYSPPSWFRPNWRNFGVYQTVSLPWPPYAFGCSSVESM